MSFDQQALRITVYTGPPLQWAHTRSEEQGMLRVCGCVLPARVVHRTRPSIWPYGRAGETTTSAREKNFTGDSFYGHVEQPCVSTLNS